MKSFIVNENDEGQRLDNFVFKVAYKLPKSLLYKNIRKKNIKVNGKKKEINYRLVYGDKVDMWISDDFFDNSDYKYEFLNASTDINIIYEDENIMLFDKPMGLLVHADDEGHCDTLINRALHYLYEKKEYLPDKENSFTPSLVNRIDRNTGGIVILAKNSASLKILNEKVKNRELKKEYLCLVYGNFKRKHDTLVAYLEKDEKVKQVRVYDTTRANAKIIKTEYTVLREYGNMSLLRVNLLTGRTHQIRAHLAYIGHPIVGDGKYGTNELNKNVKYKYQQLYSYRLTFKFDGSQPPCKLQYLNDKSFEVKHVPFVEELKNR